MSSERTYLDYIEDIHEAIQRAAEFTEGMTYEQFEQDTKTVFAVIRALEIFG